MNAEKYDNKMKTVLITGAGGFLGGELIKQLGNNPKYKIIALTSNISKLQVKFHEINNIKIISMFIVR